MLIQPQKPNSAETKPSLGLLYKMKCDKFLYNLVSASLLKYFPLSNTKNFITHSISPLFFTSSNYINPCACPFLGIWLSVFILTFTVPSILLIRQILFRTEKRMNNWVGSWMDSGMDASKGIWMYDRWLDRENFF